MRAKLINEEMGTRLKIYKNNQDNSYTIIKNSKLYVTNFNFETFSIYNWKYIGLIGNNYVINGSLISMPHIRMIMALQNKLKDE